MNGWPSFITSVLCSVLRGRLPGASALASPGYERVVVAAAVEDEPEVAHHDAGAEAAVQARLEADHVAILVDHGDVARVALVIGFAFEVDV